MDLRDRDGSAHKSLARRLIAVVLDPRPWALVAILLGLGAVLAVPRREASSAELVGIDTEFQIPSGWTQTGGRIGPPPASFRCVLIRYTSRDCPFCQADRPVFERLRQRVAAAGCQMRALSPTPEVATDDGVGAENAVAYIDLSSSNDLARLVGTPTTMLVDQKHRILWSRIGSLQQSDIEAAAAIVSPR